MARTDYCVRRTGRARFWRLHSHRQRPAREHYWFTLVGEHLLVAGHQADAGPRLPARRPYRVHDRGIDQYGYLAFGANYYWVPGTRREQIKILEYSQRLKIYQASLCLVEYPLPPEGVKNQQFSPEGQPAPPHHAHNRKHPTEAEEKHLRALAPAVSAYLDFALPTKGIQRHELIRRLQIGRASCRERV